MGSFQNIVLLLLVIIKMVSSKVSIHGLSVLIVQTKDQEHSFCTRYYPQIHNFSSTREDSTIYLLEDLLDLKLSNVCDEDEVAKNLTRKFALAHYFTSSENVTDSGGLTNCSIVDRARIVASRNASGLLMDAAMSMHTSDIPKIDFSLPVAALFYSEDKQQLLKLVEKYRDAKFLIFAPGLEERGFDGSVIIILLIAVLTLMAGSFWSGVAKQNLRALQMQEKSTSNERPADEDDEEMIYKSEENAPPPEEISLRISPIFIGILVVTMCIMILLLYFFYDKLVYAMICLFCIASAMAVYSCFEPIVMWTYTAFPNCPTLKLPHVNMYVCHANLELRQLLLLLGSIAISVVWAVYRNEYWAWILQDILAIIFSINMLKVLRFPSLKMCTMLLAGLFFYDIFFVFITPLITKDGKSIMVEVATGGDSGEQMPMVYKVPHLGGNPLMACTMPFSMLGFGDVLLPGILISYCHSFDLLTGTPKRLYWIVTCTAYFLGLIATFVSLFLMNSAQPALLYLVPFTLIPVFVISLVRGDFHAMWQGDYEPQTKELVEEEPELAEPAVNETSQRLSKQDN